MDSLPMHAWHPMIVHLPLGLLLGGVAVEAAGWLAGRPALRRTGLVLLTAGVLFALPAIASGLLAYNRVDHSESGHALMELHRNLMLIAVSLFTVAVAWRWRTRERTAGRRSGSLLYAALLTAASAFLVVGADRGADLVFRHATGLASARLQEILRERVDAQEHPPADQAESAAGDSARAPAQEDSARPSHTH